MKHFDQWLDALRSGQYKQGKGKLRFCDYYCSLGVLADVIDSSAWLLIFNGRYLWYNSMTSLEHPIVKSYSMRIELDYKGECITAIELNDTYELTFQQIAEVYAYYWEQFDDRDIKV